MKELKVGDKVQLSRHALRIKGDILGIGKVNSDKARKRPEDVYTVTQITPIDYLIEGDGPVDGYFMTRDYLKLAPR